MANPESCHQEGAMASKKDDVIFKGHGTLADVAFRCFRFCAYFPYRAAHPYPTTEAFEELFACFAPMSRTDCDRIR